MQFPAPPFINEDSDLMDKEESCSNLDDQSSRGDEVLFSATELVEEFSEFVHESEPIPDVAEGLAPANHLMDEELEADSRLEIYDGHQEAIDEDPEPIEQAVELHPGEASDDLNLCDEQPTNKGEPMPLNDARRRELSLSVDTIRVEDLANLLGLRGYEVLRDLVELEHFAKTTDSVSAELAVKVGLKHGVDFVMTDSAAGAEVRKNGVSSPPPASADYDNSAFQIDNGQYVRAGDWIRDLQLGLGRILKLNTDPLEPDRHQVWFVGNTEEGTVVERHALYSSTLGIIDQSMVPEDIRSVAPSIDQEKRSMDA